MPNSEFFGRRNEQAVLKHGVLARYAHYFAGRAGSATGGRVAFIDGYAGEGRYADGSPGSPLLLASQARRAQMFGRDVRLAFVEQDDARRQQLTRSLEEGDVVADQLLGGTLEGAIEGLLDRYSNSAVLLFVDPFGLALSRATLEAVLSRRTPRQPIDVVYHFSLSTVARMGRAGVGDGATASQNAALLDDSLGAVDWRLAFREATDPAEPTHAALHVAGKFGASVQSVADIPSTGIAVRRRPGTLPKYVLMLFSADAKAHWDYADVAGRAHVDWLHHCDRADYRANLQAQAEAGIQQLFSDPEPDREELDTQLRVEAVEYLCSHIAEELAEHQTLRPIDTVSQIYGEWLGRARATHVREALRRLHREGLIADSAVGDYWLRSIALLGA